MRGRASPHRRRGPTPCITLGSSPPAARSFSPARLNAVGAGVPASCRARRARLHYVEREDPGGRAPRPRGTTTVTPPRNSAMPRSRPRTRILAPPRAHRRHPQQNPQVTTITAPATEVFPDRLTIVFLRWLGAAIRGEPSSVMDAHIWLSGLFT